jgi:hypothetical protein
MREKLCFCSVVTSVGSGLEEDEKSKPGRRSGDAGIMKTFPVRKRRICMNELQALHVVGVQAQGRCLLRYNSSPGGSRSQGKNLSKRGFCGQSCKSNMQKTQAEPSCRRHWQKTLVRNEARIPGIEVLKDWSRFIGCATRIDTCSLFSVGNLNMRSSRTEAFPITHPLVRTPRTGNRFRTRYAADLDNW